MSTLRRAYRGRVVQMDAAFSVIADGIIWTDGGRIASVADAATPPPVGFEHIEVMDVGGTIFPGLIELHNHLCYDILPMWQVPARYGDRNEWGRGKEYSQRITGPMARFAEHPGFGPAVCRYVEAKCLLGGVTTSQGITLNKQHFERFFRGIVRNVEDPLDAQLHRARARISDVEAADIVKFFKQIKAQSCQLLHVSEGINAKARRHFLDFEMTDGTWALWRSLAAIHCNALKRVDFDRLKGVDASMVWSPLSNLMLYGQTADIKAAKDAGLRIALGSDWSPSGSKNLLHELRIASIASNVAGDVFSDREIVAMATRNAAAILTWQDHLGSIEPRKLADFIVLRGKTGDPYRNLLRADEHLIRFVVINGEPRVAVPELARGFPREAEAWTVGREPRLLNLDDAAADEIVSGLTLAAATATLRETLAAPKRAAAVLKSTLGKALSPARAAWRLVLEHEEPPDASIRTRFASAKDPGPTMRSSEMMATKAPPGPVEPIDLDPLTVADDPGYFVGLRSQRNIPPEVKAALP